MEVCTYRLIILWRGDVLEKSMDTYSSTEVDIGGLVIVYSTWDNITKEDGQALRAEGAIRAT